MADGSDFGFSIDTFKRQPDYPRYPNLHAILVDGVGRDGLPYHIDTK